MLRREQKAAIRKPRTSGAANGIAPSELSAVRGRWRGEAHLIDAGLQREFRNRRNCILALEDELNLMADDVNQIESVRAQLNNLEAQLGDDQESKSIRTAADDLSNKLIALEGNLLQLKATGHGQDDVRWESMLVDKLDYLARQLGTSDFAPTTQEVAVHNLLKQEVAKYHDETQQLMSKDVAAFNSMLRGKNVSNIITRTP
jgi:hypothetical protein